MIVLQILHHLLASIPLVRVIVGWSTREGLHLHRHLERSLRAALLSLNSSLATSERLASRLYAWLSYMLSGMPCGVYKPQDSAVVILGDIDGLGRAVALSFSELGYTVFMLSTSSSEPALSGVTEKSSAVLSLLYAWHTKKERSPAAHWGTVAPITLDTHSAAQRTHAAETVHAYCEDHALQLCALIVLPAAPSPARRGPGSRAPPKPGADGGRAAAMWGGGLEAAAREPLAIVRDYSDLLTRAAGRVVLMSRCVAHNAAGADRLLDGTRECLAVNLNQALEPLGVRVCSLTTGAPEDFGEYPPSPSVAHGDPWAAGEFDPSAKQATPGGSNPDDAHTDMPYHGAVCDVLRDIASTAYPKTVYTVGYRPWLSWAWRVAPNTARLVFISPIAQRLIEWCCWS
ncbi:hypothetical protein PsYK624_113530 [Phanerochaete sordida]|uniref:Ketoreductase (KR) domain-containing protein n=1 Tax=Phanerochaete sordida TaxID=48140 RepID=A0A9P3LIH7_9APHY|nr:hypothetical protein PsYK624_113530 [Phanerochaete sordida]